VKAIIIKAYRYDTKCFECTKLIPIYFTIPGVGYPPTIKKCKYCDTLYWHSITDEEYGLLEKYIVGKKCVQCHADLSEALVQTHTNIKCCNTSFSLDIFPPTHRHEEYIEEKVKVYLL